MNDIKVEIGQLKTVDKGALKAFFSLIIHPQGQKILDCRYFQKGESRWWSMPQKEIKRPDKDKSDFLAIISYLNKEYEADLKIAVLTELKKQVENVQPKQENPVQSETQELWF